MALLPSAVWSSIEAASWQRQSAIENLGNRWRVVISVRDPAHVRFCERYRNEIEFAMDKAGFNPSTVQLEFRIEQEVSLPL